MEEKNTAINSINKADNSADKETAAVGKAAKKAEKKAMREDKPKRKFKKKYIVLIVIAALVIAYIIYSLLSSRNAVTYVTTEAAQTGDIEVIVSLSGTVASADTQSYYSAITAPIASLPYKAGDRVSTGDIIYTYDADELEIMRRQAELTVTQAESNYSGTIAKNAKSTVARSGLSMTQIQDRLDEITVEIDALNKLIDEKMARMNRTLTDLQKTAMDVDQNHISDSTDASEGNDAPLTRKNDDGHQMSLEIQEAISEVQYALSYDPEITAWKAQINTLNEEKAKLQEQASAEQAALTSDERSALEAQRDLTTLDSGSTLDNIAEVENGVTAQFSGVITEIGAEEGATVTKGTKIMTIASTDDVTVNIQISKSDVGRIRPGQTADITIGSETYTGEVTQISGTAVKNSSGVAVVDAKITISDPNESIILGVEASCKIHTDHAEGVIVIPYAYIGTDADGDYVYMIEDGAIVRRDVVIGLSNTTSAEITEGINAGDRIITTDIDTLTVGMPAVDMDITAE